MEWIVHTTIFVIPAMGHLLDEKNRMGPPRRFDHTAQAPHYSDQTTELNSCINPNSKVKISFCKDVRGDRGSIFYGGQNTTD